MIDLLPPDLFSEVLSRLDPDDLLLTPRVCKAFMQHLVHREELHKVINLALGPNKETIKHPISSQLCSWLEGKSGKAQTLILSLHPEEMFEEPGWEKPVVEFVLSTFGRVQHLILDASLRFSFPRKCKVNLQTLQTLTIHHWDPITVCQCLKFAENNQIRELRLWGPALKPSTVQYEMGRKLRARKLRNLQHLVVSDVLEVDVDTGLLAKRLQTLEFHRVPTISFRIYKSTRQLRQFGSLNSLILTDCSLESFDGHVLAFCPDLITLDLSQNKLKGLSLLLDSSSTIRSLILRGNRLSQIPSCLFCLLNLATLDMSHNPPLQVSNAISEGGLHSSVKGTHGVDLVSLVRLLPKLMNLNIQQEGSKHWSHASLLQIAAVKRIKLPKLRFLSNASDVQR